MDNQKLEKAIDDWAAETNAAETGKPIQVNPESEKAKTKLEQIAEKWAKESKSNSES